MDCDDGLSVPDAQAMDMDEEYLNSSQDSGIHSLENSQSDSSFTPSPIKESSPFFEQTVTDKCVQDNEDALHVTRVQNRKLYRLPKQCVNLTSAGQLEGCTDENMMSPDILHPRGKSTDETQCFYKKWKQQFSCLQKQLSIDAVDSHSRDALYIMHPQADNKELGDLFGAELETVKRHHFFLDVSRDSVAGALGIRNRDELVLLNSRLVLGNGSHACVVEMFLHLPIGDKNPLTMVIRRGVGNKFEYWELDCIIIGTTDVISKVSAIRVHTEAPRLPHMFPCQPPCEMIRIRHCGTDQFLTMSHSQLNMELLHRTTSGDVFVRTTFIMATTDAEEPGFVSQFSKKGHNQFLCVSKMSGYDKYVIRVEDKSDDYKPWAVNDPTLFRCEVHSNESSQLVSMAKECSGYFVSWEEVSRRLLLQKEFMMDTCLFEMLSAYKV